MMDTDDGRFGVADRATAVEPVPVSPLRDGIPSAELRVALQRGLIAALGDTYDCTRVWSAWSYGTMDEQDFVPVLDRLEEVIDELVLQIAVTITPPCQPEQPR